MSRPRILAFVAAALLVGAVLGAAVRPADEPVTVTKGMLAELLCQVHTTPGVAFTFDPATTRFVATGAPIVASDPDVRRRMAEGRHMDAMRRLTIIQAYWQRQFRQSPDIRCDGLL